MSYNEYDITDDNGGQVHGVSFDAMHHAFITSQNRVRWLADQSEHVQYALLRFYRIKQYERYGFLRLFVRPRTMRDMCDELIHRVAVRKLR